MIDTFSLFLSHTLMMILCWRLLSRPDLDDDHADPDSAPVSLVDRLRALRSKPPGA